MKFFVGLMMSCIFLFASVDINNASEKELAKLKGVGEAKAKEIISYRDTNGCFKSIDELSKVKGIGTKTIEKNRDSLSLGECKK